MGRLMRLDRFLAEMKKGSRSEIRERIRKGCVSVDGQVIRDADFKVDPERMQIMLNGEAVDWAAVEYYMLYKPRGVVSATEDKLYKTAVELIGTSRRRDLFPVGRLDLDTEGLLLITSDGALAHRLLSPRKHVDKVYFARVSGTLPEDVIERFAAGITLKDKTTVKPAGLEIIKSREEAGGNFQEVRLTIQEGKFHQVKRMFEAVGGEVVYLKRLSMGPLVLDESLKPGEYRALTKNEIKMLTRG